jgi:methyltransferase (TIGR00027 family)
MPANAIRITSTNGTSTLTRSCLNTTALNTNRQKAWRFCIPLRMVLDPVHRTAFTAAWYRTAHLRFDGEPKVFEDRLALDLTGASADEFLEWWEANRESPFSPALWALRSRYTEDRLDVSRRRGVNQYVLLGAGLDSFVHRNAASLPELRVFEVDDPPLQEWKRSRLAELALAEPDGCMYVPCDFEQTRLVEALRAAGFNAEAPAFVSWLAVTQYLTVPAIIDTLRWAAGLPAGSELVLTYVVPGPAAEHAKQMWEQQGVSFATFFLPEEIEDLLRQSGFELVEHLEPDDADRTYFAGRDDGLQAPRSERLVSAVVT